MRRMHAAAVLFLCFFSTAFAYDWSTNPGDGSAGNPYQISTAEQLMSIGSDSVLLSKHFILTNDIDLTGKIFTTAVIAPDTTVSSSFEGTKYTGKLNGNGHVISNLNIDARNNYYIGLFGYVDSGGQVKNLGLENINISGSHYVGGLVGYNNGIITTSYSNGSVSGSFGVGGLVGENRFDGNITSCYATGSVNSFSSLVGGLVGINYGTIASCYSTGNVSGSSYVGGLVGYNDDGPIAASFWDTQTSGQATSSGGIGKTTLQMKDILLYSSNNWGESWTIDSGNDYPRLTWENANGTVITAPTVTMAGSGTADDPWIISSKEDFLQVCGGLFFWNKQYRLDTDIDLSGAIYQLGLIGYGKDNSCFTGVFDGNGHKISNLTINTLPQDYVGLFGYVGFGGQVKNLGLKNISISGSTYVGGLVGYNNGTITTCYSSGSVSGSSIVGGLVGINGGSIAFCYSSSNVSGYYYAGGLVGCNSDTITTCYSIGSVSDSYCYAGGLVGYNYQGTITNCYSTDSVSDSEEYVGGLLGYNDGGAITASFWNFQSSGLDHSSGGIGKTSAEMKTLSTFTDAGWDFAGETENGTEDIWAIDPAINEGYPYLVQMPLTQGDGSAGNPYRISTVEQLMEIGSDSERLTKNFILTNDIDLAGQVFDQAVIAPDMDGLDNQFNGTAFTGVFDGNGYRITNFTLTGSDVIDHIGLFGLIGPGGQVKNLSLENIAISGPYWIIGGLCGTNQGAIIDCHVSGIIQGGTGDFFCGYGMGGLCGENDYGTINNCSAVITIKNGRDDYGCDIVGGLCGLNRGLIIACDVSETLSCNSIVGGLCGKNEGGTIRKCYTAGTIVGIGSSPYDIGGLVGGNECNGEIIFCHAESIIEGMICDVGGLCGYNYGTITSSWASADINGYFNVGGFAGVNWGGIISECCSIGNISGIVETGENTGGFVGLNYGVITSCYTTGDVTGYARVGGFVGVSNGTMTSCYVVGTVNVIDEENAYLIGGFAGDNSYDEIIGCFWDTEISGQSTSAGGTGKTSMEMKTLSTFTSAGWDFADIWSLCEGTNYPRLQWQIPAWDFACPDGVGVEDLEIFVGRWLSSDCMSDNNYCGGADVNASGNVDLADYAVFAGHWMEGLEL